MRKFFVLITALLFATTAFAGDFNLTVTPQSGNRYLLEWEDFIVGSLYQVNQVDCRGSVGEFCGVFDFLVIATTTDTEFLFKSKGPLRTRNCFFVVASQGGLPGISNLACVE